MSYFLDVIVPFKCLPLCPSLYEMKRNELVQFCTFDVVDELSQCMPIIKVASLEALSICEVL